jgi:hypothetical protein
MNTSRIARVIYASATQVCYILQNKGQPARHRYYSASSGGLQANDEGTSDAGEFEAALTEGQKASTRLSLRSASRPDPRSLSSGSRPHWWQLC